MLNAILMLAVIVNIYRYILTTNTIGLDVEKLMKEIKSIFRISCHGLFCNCLKMHISNICYSNSPRTHVILVSCVENQPHFYFFSYLLLFCSFIFPCMMKDRLIAGN